MTAESAQHRPAKLPVILDGTRLAGRRSAMLVGRAAEVLGRRGSAPRVLIVAFGDDRGRVPHVARKLEACSSVGVAADLNTVPGAATTEDAIALLRASLTGERPDGIFVQFPFPPAIDGNALVEAIPPALDVDVMTPACMTAFMRDIGALPPVTVSAALMLLDEYRIPLDSRSGLLVADPGPFARMFREALVRRGVAMQPVIAPAAADLPERLRTADLVVVAAARPGSVRSGALAPGTVTIDVGYFNRGGRGDIDVSDGIDHLAAIMPVPGGIGPMTVSALIERVVLFAERSLRPA